MAEIVKFISACALLFVLAVCCGITSAEGRVLKEHGEDLTENNTNNFFTTNYYGERSFKLGRNLAVHVVNGETRHASEPYNYHISGTVDDFRPTDPGHSPGAGHSKGPGSISPNDEPGLN